MINQPFTSKKLIGKPAEPALIKKLLKTKLFKNSRQAGRALILLSIACWLVVILVLIAYIQDKKLADQPSQREITTDLPDADPILIQALLEKEAAAQVTNQ